MQKIIKESRKLVVVMILFAVIGFGISVKAQDVITLKNGTDIQALVQEIGEIDVKYKKFENPNGPNYTLKKTEILIIRYENGSKDIFSEEVKSIETKNNISNEIMVDENSPHYTVLSELGFLITPSLGSYTWYEAKEKCRNLIQGGFKDWYLPSKDEFELILKQNPNFEKTLKKFWHWTSSEINSKKAYNIGSSGWASDEIKNNNRPDCMCIRKISTISQEASKLNNNETLSTSTISISESAGVKNNKKLETAYLQENMQSKKDNITTTSQEAIIKKDGSEIKAKVIEITDQQIKYKDFDFQSGPTRNINISEVFMIIYENGQKEVFNKPAEQKDISKEWITYIDNVCVLNTNCGIKIMCYDLPYKMTWEEAQYACPSGYHLPTYSEMQCLCKEHSPNYHIYLSSKSSGSTFQTQLPVYNPTYGLNPPNIPPIRIVIP